MNHETILFAVGLALASAVPDTPARAQNARSFVSGHGSDANNCTLVAPCRTFAGAIVKTNAGGELTVLDPAGYGAVVIDKALSIVNDGVGEAGIALAAGVNGITVSAGPNDPVSLRGLTIDGGGIGSNGIVFNHGKSLTVERCVIRRFAADGINFNPNATSSLVVSSTIISDNGAYGILVQPSGSGTVTGVFNRVETNNNTNGVAADGSLSTGTVQLAIYRSVAAFNSASVGFSAATLSGKAPTTMTLFHSVAADNGFGLSANGPGAIIRIASSTVTGNANGWTVLNSGVVQSYSDNEIDGNSINQSAPPGTARK